jgi:hypothetical protein
MQSIPSPYVTLSQATTALLKQGFKSNFKLKGDQLMCIENKKMYDSTDMEIIKQYRFEGISNPADMSIVFAVECKDGTKGTIISYYGTYSDDKLDEFMKKVKVCKHSKASGAI